MTENEMKHWALCLPPAVPPPPEPPAQDWPQPPPNATSGPKAELPPCDPAEATAALAAAPPDPTVTLTGGAKKYPGLYNKPRSAMSTKSRYSLMVYLSGPKY